MNKKELFSRTDELNDKEIFYIDKELSIKYTGIMRQYDYLNRLSYEADIVNGLESGLCRRFYQSNVVYIREMRNNMPHGLFVEYWENATIRCIKLSFNGECLKSFHYSSDGVVEHTRECVGTIERNLKIDGFHELYHKYDIDKMHKEICEHGKILNMPKGFEFVHIQ